MSGRATRGDIAAKITSSDEEFTFFVSALSTVGLCGSGDSWVIDSGATRHMCNNRKPFSKFIDLSAPLNVEVADGRTLYAVGKGSVSLKLKGTVVKKFDVFKELTPCLRTNELSGHGKD